MSSVRTSAVHVLVTAGLGAIVVTLPMALNDTAFLVWVLLVLWWVKRQDRTRGPRAGSAELAVQLAAMSLLVLATALAPVKVVDRIKARRVVLPRQVMTIAEVVEPDAYGLKRQLRYTIAAPGDLGSRVVKFPSRVLTVNDFIAAIETETPLRHRFGSCGNGYTILEGSDCSFGLIFDVPPR